MGGNERLLSIHDVVDTAVSVEGGLNRVEGDNRTVGASSTIIKALSKWALLLNRRLCSPFFGRETDGVVESQPQGLVDLRRYDC